MTAIVASAPGKLVLCGEYAVLEGAPAIVLAMDRRAQVTLTPSIGNELTIDAPALGLHGIRGRLDGHRRMSWCNVDAGVAAQLQLVSAVLEELPGADPLTPFHAQLDTSALFAAGPSAIKLGLGSSAALAVALAGALHAWVGADAPELARLSSAHRRVQDGRGSGLDIAASLCGGAIVYRLQDGPQVTPVDWPADLLLTCVWTRRSASTGDFLRRLATWRVDAPAQHAALLGELSSCAATAAAAMLNGALNDLLDALAHYATLLARLGEASDLDIVCAEHRALAAIAADCGVVYKSCGAGGGDLGIALSTDADRLRAFALRADDAGMPPLNLRIDPCGLRVN